MRVRKRQNACVNECMSENEWEMRIACRAPTNSQNACKYARCVQVGKYGSNSSKIISVDDIIIIIIL